MTVIKDGTGEGFLTSVSNKNRLRTEAVMTPDGSEIADLGFGFMVDGTTSLINQTEKTVMIIVNTGIFTYELGRVWISVQNQQPPNTTAASSTITTIRLYVGTATATGGILKTPVNINTGALSPANITVITDNPTVQSGKDAEVKQIYFLLDDSQLLDFEGSIVLQPTGSFRVTCAGGAGILSGTLLCATNVQIYQELG